MFELPIPRFDYADHKHQALVASAKEAEEMVAGLTLSEAPNFVTARRRVRAGLTKAGIAASIDRLVHDHYDCDG